MRAGYILKKDINRYFMNEMELNSEQYIKSNSITYYIILLFSEIVTVIPFFLILFLHNLGRDRLYFDDERIIALSRLPYGRRVIEKVYNDKKIIFLEDHGLNDSLLNKFELNRRIFIIINSIGLAFRIYLKMNKLLYRYNKKTACFYLLRIPQYALYITAIDEIFSHYRNDYILSSQIIDRFAFAEQVIANHYGIKRYVVPHGLEPLNNLVEIPCDGMWCTSKYASSFLNKKYKTNRFWFSDEIVTKMYARELPIIKRNKIVFFSQGKEYAKQTIPYIRWLIEYVDKSEFYDELIFKSRINGEEVELFGKLLEKMTLSNDIDDCLSSKICISFFSTTLYEALFNNSKSISINCKYIKEHPEDHINNNDEIIKISNIRQLKNVLDEEAEKGR